MQIPPGVFWQMTWGEFLVAAEGYYLNQMEKFDLQRRLMCMIRNANTNPKDHIEPERLWPLPIDDTYDMYTGANIDLTPAVVDNKLAEAQKRLSKRPFLQKFLNPEKK